MATLVFSKKKDQTDQARQVQNQSKQSKQTHPDSFVCSLDLPLICPPCKLKESLAVFIDESIGLTTKKLVST